MTDNFIKILSNMSNTQTAMMANMIAGGLGVTAIQVLPGQERKLPRDLPDAIRKNGGQKLIDKVGFNFNTEPDWFDICVDVLKPTFSPTVGKDAETFIFFLVGDNDLMWYVIPPI